MHIKSKIEGFEDWLFIEELPDTFNANTPLAEKRMTIKRPPVQEFSNYMLSSGGMFLMHAKMQFDEQATILFEIEGETINSQFIFYENVPVTDDKDSKKMRGGARHNIRYIPSLSGKYELTKGVSYSYFLVVLSKEYYFHLINKDSILHADFVEEIKNGKYTSISAKDLLVSHEMRQIINDIVECRKTGEIKRLFTEAKILELLMLQMEQIQNDQLNETNTFTPVEQEKVEYARDLLDEQFVNPPVLPVLSRLVGLNEFKLKRGFKAYFGTTIYGYVTRLKMEHARHLLIDKKLTVREVTYEVGFKHQSHLSEAFKKYYGILPSEIKQ
ncbi:helix-turn-helix transcriptional regulator [Mucilaginibacter sp. JRF]|uniref:AraC family transcriptional regulator n=1 Tax=Mucilaginibacter sp. JRF TaxID=2780088 RepID=UPI00187ED56E|nr:AraC family transcriptional regulator [Mucilaginibacter sp. JRF]MBE9583504.1 helix-turn-helix transcriptional regulator [Mucilaginibacter sp. JRF]